MMGEKTKIILDLPNGQKESIVLDAVLFGGIIGDGSGFPCGGYNGDLDMSKTVVSMVHIMRAYLKIAEEQGLNKDMAKVSLEYAMTEALKRENTNDPLDNIDLQTHMVKMRKDKK